MPERSASVLTERFGGGLWAEQDEISWFEPPRRTEPRPSEAEALRGGGRAVPHRAEVALPQARRTIQISGRGAERHLPPSPNRRTPAHRGGARRAPDRIALWAVLLGIVLLLVAATSSHAATTRPTGRAMVRAETRIARSAGTSWPELSRTSGRN